MTDMSDLPGEDHLAIAAVIREETEAFRLADFNRWSRCWVHDARTHDVYVSHEAGLIVISGWDAVGRHMEDAMRAGKGCGMVDFAQDDHRITVHGDMAWVVYAGKTHHRDGAVSNTFETRILEKADGAWRIVYSSVATAHPNGRFSNHVALDREGHIIWGSDSALDRLATHPALTVSYGRLRARRPVWDKALQAALARAAECHGYFDQYGFSERAGRPFRCPVVLGEDDDGSVIVCTLTAQDGATYLALDTDADLPGRLSAARAIFGLSEGQTTVAAEICRGRGIAEVAETLGITVNTARTHLKRIYEKTGVNAQTALVRLLLSVG